MDQPRKDMKDLRGRLPSDLKRRFRAMAKSRGMTQQLALEASLRFVLSLGDKSQLIVLGQLRNPSASDLREMGRDIQKVVERVE